MREQRHISKKYVFKLLPSKDIAFFSTSGYNSLNYTLKNGHQGGPTTLNIYITNNVYRKFLLSLLKSTNSSGVTPFSHMCDIL